jgi:polar amino acid transport system permease protein
MEQLILKELGEGFLVTLALFFITLIVSLPLGLLITFCTMSKFKPLKYLFKGIVWIIRGTPLMLQILFISFVPSMLNIMNKDLANLLDVSINNLMFIFVTVAFVINYACYFSEIYRGAIESIPKGQYEAGNVLGMNKFQIFTKVIFMQVIKRTLAPISNEVITLVKDTALAQVLGVVDLLSASKHAVNTYVVMTPFLYAGIFYLLFNGGLTLLFGFLEKKLSYIKE